MIFHTRFGHEIIIIIIIEKISVELKLFPWWYSKALKVSMPTKAVVEFLVATQLREKLRTDRQASRTRLQWVARRESNYSSFVSFRCSF